ncbi:MAG: hypothetical protein Q8Q49_00575 [bacterium]|nr:hypothetical protein [bacterium]
MDAFLIKKDDALLDYWTPGKLDLAEVTSYFQKNYRVENLFEQGRHITGILHEEDETYFLKLATSPGISILTQNEAEWNKSVSTQASKTDTITIPHVYEAGYFQKKFFYYISEYLQGELLCSHTDTRNQSALLPEFENIVQAAELVTTFSFVPSESNLYAKSENHTSYFKDRALRWLNGIPEQIRSDYRVTELTGVVDSGAGSLDKRTRHGDFTPWHMMKLGGGKLGLIDGEHALPHGVEYYDIAYFIQRVFVVLQNPDVAKQMVVLLLSKGYDKEKLRTVLAARGVGGYLDVSLSGPEADFSLANEFQNFVKTL